MTTKEQRRPMIRVKTIMLACLGALVLSGVAAATSLAAGELVNSKKEALIKNKVTVKGGEQLVETTTGTKLTCKEFKGTGTVKSTTEGESTRTFTGCESGKVKCQTEKAAEGEIVITGMRWWVIKSKIDDLLDNFLTKEISFKCGGTNGALKGGYTVPVEPMKTLKKTFTFTAKETGGKQEPFDEMNDTLTLALGGPATAAAVKGTEEFTFEEEAEFI